METTSNPTNTHRIGDSATIPHHCDAGVTVAVKLVNIKDRNVFGHEGPFGTFCDVRMLAERPNHNGGQVLRMDDPSIVWAK